MLNSRARWGIRALSTLTLAAMTAIPAQAAQIRFSGSGTVTAVTPDAAPASGSVAVGDALSFAFTFDTANASLVFNGGLAFQVFEQPLTHVSASIGGFTFTPDPPTGSLPVILLGTSFRFFPGEGSVPVFNQSFVLPGLPAGNVPFGNGATGGVTFSLESTFRQNLIGVPVTLANLSNPAGAAINRFTVVVSDGQNVLGRVEGSFTGSFAAAVPEPGTWALLILGFGVVGGAMRSRRPVRRLVAA